VNITAKCEKKQLTSEKRANTRATTAHIDRDPNLGSKESNKQSSLTRLPLIFPK